jgi:hypothetical protein
MPTFILESGATYPWNSSSEDISVQSHGEAVFNSDHVWAADRASISTGVWTLSACISVVQYYENVGGGTQRALVFGFRTKVEF